MKIAILTYRFLPVPATHKEAVKNFTDSYLDIYDNVATIAKKKDILFNLASAVQNLHHNINKLNLMIDVSPETRRISQQRELYPTFFSYYLNNI